MGLRTSTISNTFVLLHLLQCVFSFVNLSVNKTADMSTSQYTDKWLAVEAVDGDVSQKVAQGSCAVTSDNFHKQAWWRVDLGDIYILNSVRIYYRKESDDPADSLTHRLSGFSIYVADTLNWWIGTRCYLHNNGNHTNPGPSDILTVPCNATGRYVTVYKQRNGSCTWNSNPIYKRFCAKFELCEVQVLSCENGRYGESCKKNCSGNCLNGVHCNKAHGGCDDGCALGYRGFNCNNTCPFGRYGVNCESNCSANCKTASVCSHDNGNCLGGCSEGWEGHHCDQPLVQPIMLDITDTKFVTYLGLTAGCLIAVLVMTIFLIMFIRRKFARKKKEIKEEWRKSRMFLDFDGENITEGLDNVAMAIIDTTPNTIDDTSIGDEQRYCNQIEVTNIPVSDLADVIRYKTDSGNAFRDEFKSLSEGEGGSSNVGRLPANIPKNRYKNMIPYDHSRVMLMAAGENETDYINASYIKDMENKRAYIACQGPKQTTLREHWRMIWQENIDTIVMLTNLKEKVKVKCYQYWPDTRLPLTSGNITIENKGEIKYPFFIVRQFKVSNAKSNEERMLKHFHFTNWPDHCTPDPLELISFYRKVISSKQNEPMLVHCSAGLGRTGVFIALDALMTHGQNTETVKVFNYVKKMRKYRMNMVQTLEQYVFVHEMVLEGLRYIDHVIDKSDFTRQYKNILKTGSIKSEFEDLIALRPVYGADHFIAGNCVENMDKNVDQDILPLDSFAVRLTPIRNETSDYINAIYVPSYTNKDGFIVSQFPQPHTVYDLWRMMYGYSSSTLVVLNNQTTTCEWMPEARKEKTVGPFQIQADAETPRDKHVVEYKLKINCTETHVKTPLSIKVFKANVFTKSKTLQKDSNNVFLVLMKYLFAWRRQNLHGSITVLSSNGAEGCGLFCGLYAAIEHIQQVKEVDIFTIMRQLQIRRPQLCSTLEEYQACYSAVSHIIQHENAYSSHGVSDEDHDKNVYINTDLGKLW